MTTSIMIIRCPQCQYANKVEAEAAKPRIVCSRCATVVSIEFLSNYELPASRLSEAPLPQIPLDMNKQETSPLDLDSLLETDSDLPVAPVQPVNTAPLPVSEEFSDLIGTPNVSVRSDDEEILDIPRSNSAVTAGMEARIEELIEGGTDRISGVGDSVSGLTGSATNNVTDAAGTAYDKVNDAVGNIGGKAQDTLGAAGGVLGSLNPFGKATDAVSSIKEQTSEYVAEAKDFVTGDNENKAEAASAAFGQDSYNFKNPKSSTFVMATPDSNNRGLLTKLMLGAAALCALLAIGWFALSGSIKELFVKKTPDPVVTNVPPPPVKPAVAPGTVPSLGAKVGASPGAVPAGSVAAGASPAASVAASVTSSKPAETKPSVVASAAPTVTAKVAPTSAAPAPVPANSGHAVGATNGSLTIQIGAFKSEAEANSRISKLKASGIDARVVKAEVLGKGTWFRVQAGRFTNEGEASKYGSELKAKGSARDFIVTGYQGQ